MCLGACISILKAATLADNDLILAEASANRMLCGPCVFKQDGCGRRKVWVVIRLCMQTLLAAFMESHDWLLRVSVEGCVVWL